MSSALVILARKEAEAGVSVESEMMSWWKDVSLKGIFGFGGPSTEACLVVGVVTFEPLKSACECSWLRCYG